jgi:hypothetical protein
MLSSQRRQSHAWRHHTTASLAQSVQGACVDQNKQCFTAIKAHVVQLNINWHWEPAYVRLPHVTSAFCLRFNKRTAPNMPACLKRISQSLLASPPFATQTAIHASGVSCLRKPSTPAATDQGRTIAPAYTHEKHSVASLISNRGASSSTLQHLQS